MDMRDMSERLADAVLISACTATILVGMLYWLEPSEEIESDDFTVTIDCRSVIMNPGEFPESVVTECRDKVRFIKETSLQVV
jgi:hypothetical protein